MTENSALEDRTRSPHRKSPGCGIAATPEVRRRLLALAVAVLAPAMLPLHAEAQSSASGTVRLIIRGDALPPSSPALDSEVSASDPSEPALTEEEPFGSPASRAEGDFAFSRSGARILLQPLSADPDLTEPVLVESVLAGRVAGKPVAKPDSTSRRAGPGSAVERQPD